MRTLRRSSTGQSPGGIEFKLTVGVHGLGKSSGRWSSVGRGLSTERTRGTREKTVRLYLCVLSVSAVEVLGLKHAN